ncbi:alpha beta hydrolase fold-1 domain-containing protein [Plasmopara halstedii]|uniref:Alpha beta hydrolase fold-1 domain-containing protein n=1 Tax=Plasmopara halstedii TaxID=4781 RepID=A0A0P1ADS2_PLAHL|nr:alpha beta hydrolase fold-1 domain-containing protein [Plasmopara halstedii]CEG38682.1 alpha beta hydrolase fold-1 domain-containing protein [Plasmopara halstedii]|eukprot:XP_024575051.1 alpha beta hydrolase fold-1 domain-containing protein [Plasmopara halstedii]
MDDSATASDRRGMWSMVKEGYEGLVSTVIRPLRAQYAPSELGPKRAQIGELSIQRTDLKLKNPAGYTLECSWWKPRKSKTEPTSEQEKRPCILVLHGNSSCRLGALEILMYALPAGFTVFALDFCGSGLSQGKFVSLGYHEQADIATAVKYVRKTGEISSLCLWGRSMGAVAALMYAESDATINAMVLDSPFSSLPKLATELVEDGKLGVPKIAVKLVMRLIRRDIKKRAKFDMFKLKPIAKIHKCVVPAFFVVGLQDELVGPHHVEALYKLHNGPNQLFKFPGGHNCQRPFNFFIQALQFLRVMVGLMPLPDDLSTFDLSPDERQNHIQLHKKASPKRKKPTRLYKNPLEPGLSIEAVHKMSIKELKQSIDRAGYSDVTCIEKIEMVELVLKLYARYRRSSKHAADDRQIVEESKVPNPTSSETRLSTETRLIAPDNSDVVSGEKQRRRSEGDTLRTADDFEAAEDSPSLSMMKTSASSVLSEAELDRRLSIDYPSDSESKLEK